MASSSYELTLRPVSPMGWKRARREDRELRSLEVGGKTKNGGEAEDGRPLLAVVAVCYYPAFVSLLRRSDQAKPARYEDGRMKADERRQRTELGNRKKEREKNRK